MRWVLVSMVVSFASTASADDTRPAFWAGSMREVPAEVEGPRAWTTTATIVGYDYDLRHKGWLPIEAATWPAAPRLEDRELPVGARVEVLSMRCLVDARKGRRVHCEDGRAPPPGLWVEAFGGHRTEALPPLLAQCFDVQRVPPTAAELKRARSILARGRRLSVDPFVRGDRLVHIVVHEVHLERETIRLQKRRVVDVHERVESYVVQRAPRVDAKPATLLRIVPLVEGGVEPGFEALTFRGAWFPGVLEYTARRLVRVDGAALAHDLAALLEYDRAVHHVGVGDTDRAAAALVRLDRLGAVSKPLDELLSRALPDVRALAAGERLLFHPCTGALR